MKSGFRFTQVSILIVILSMITGIASMQQNPDEPPVPQGFPHVNARNYVPGPIWKSMGAVIMDDRGNSIKFASQDITNGRPVLPRSVYVNNKYRGESNLWFSGNYAWAFGSSTLTQATGTDREVCAKIATFATAYGASSGQINPACEPRSAAWHWVLSPQKLNGQDVT